MQANINFSFNKNANNSLTVQAYATRTRHRYTIYDTLEKLTILIVQPRTKFDHEHIISLASDLRDRICIIIEDDRRSPQILRSTLRGVAKHSPSLIVIFSWSFGNLTYQPTPFHPRWTSTAKLTLSTSRDLSVDRFAWLAVIMKIR